MTKTKKIISTLAAITLVVMAGCEWGTPSSDETWTMNGYDWFDFSGTYRGATGGPVVTGFTYEDPTTEGVVQGEVIASASSTNSSAVIMPGESILSPVIDLTGPTSEFPSVQYPEQTMSTLCSENLIHGTVVINLAGGAKLVDDSLGGFTVSSGSLTLNPNSSVNYNTGAVKLIFTLTTIDGFSTFVNSTVSYDYGVTSASSGNFAHSSVVAGSVTIFAGDYVFTDDGVGGLSASVSGQSGTISYTTGAWSINLGGLAISGDITASYAYTVDQPFEPGNTGTPIVTLSISQVGNKLTIIDSMGRTFNGTIGVANGSGGTTQPTSEDDYSSQVMAQFTAYYGDIEIIGTLTGLYSSDEPGVLFDRTIQAVWIEPTVQGDVNGVAGSLYVPEFVTATATTTPTTTTP